MPLGEVDAFELAARFARGVVSRETILMEEEEVEVKVGMIRVVVHDGVGCGIDCRSGEAIEEGVWVAERKCWM